MVGISITVLMASLCRIIIIVRLSIIFRLVPEEEGDDGLLSYSLNNMLTRVQNETFHVSNIFIL